MTRARPAEERSIVLKDGTRLFVHAILPPFALARSARAKPPRPSGPAVHGGDARMAAIVDKAERLANVNVAC